MWRLAKLARNRDGAYERGITPSLTQLDGTVAGTVDEKAPAFRAAFFPQPPLADLSDTTNFNYPHPIDFPPIIAHEIEEAVRSAKAGKAPGEAVSNRDT
jgi:hypothetical protein